MTTATVSFRIPTQIRDSAKPILEANGMTVSELCQNVLAYVAETGKLPIKKVVLSEEDEELIRIARKRLQEPGSIPVQLKDL
jgi:RHH-type rel operon transcriptional repressor/antitoxin RelB